MNNMGNLLVLMFGLFFLLTLDVQAQSDQKVISKLEQGRQIYNYRCYYCHGYSGDAKTLAAKSLNPAPRDFTSTSLEQLTREQMIGVVTEGKPETGMTGFTKFLTRDDIELVVDFIREEFMTHGKENTRYHTVENGWPEHQKYKAAYPFATGEIALDVKQETLSEEQRLGLQLYLSSCITCHDNSRVENEGDIWRSQSISFPRNNFSFTNFDGYTGASTYQKHDTFELLDTQDPTIKQGEQLFRDNCAFCHAMDGTGHNWIGSFLEVKPRNLQSTEFMQRINKTVLKQMIRNGKVNTSMPAWKDVLTEQQIDAIISYIDEAFHKVDD